MEIVIPHSNLIQTLELIGKTCTKSSTLPVLQCVRIEAGKDGINLQATNLEISITTPLQGTVIEEGVIAVPAQTLLQSVQFLSQKELTLRTEDNVLLIETTSSNTSIKLFPADDFPTLHRINGEELTINTEMFSYGIKSVAFAASVTSIKPELGSVFIQQKKEHTLTFVATDSFRLMEKTVAQKGFTLEQSFMIPSKNAMELARVCDISEGNVKLIVTDNHCALNFENGVYVSSRLVTGSFPDYTQIIPKEYVSHVTVLKDDILRSFKRTNIFLNKFRQVAFTITDSSLTIASNNNEIGHTTDTIRADVEGEELSLNFNQQYVMDPLQHIQDDSVIMHFAGIGRAMVLEGLTDKSLRYLVMPMNK